MVKLGDPRKHIGVKIDINCGLFDINDSLNFSRNDCYQDGA
jgi:hypothetical protein